MLNINYVSTTTGRLYGLAQNRKSYIVSDDGGDTWLGISEEEYRTLLNTNRTTLEPAIVFPYDSRASQTVDQLFNDFGVTFDITVKWGGKPNINYLYGFEMN